MKKYNRITKIAPYICPLGNTQPIEGSREIPTGTAAEIARRDPTMVGYLSFRGDDGTVARGPKIRLGKIWDSARGYILPERFEELHGCNG